MEVMFVFPSFYPDLANGMDDWEMKLSMMAFRNGNGAGSGRVAPIPTPPRLLKRILIPVPFKKLNGAGRVWEIPIPALPRLV